MKPQQIQQIISNTYKYNRNNDYEVDGYKIDKSLSGKRVSVYHNPTTNKTVISHRGTKLNSLSDWSNNFRYMIGDYDNTKRLKHAKKIQKQTEDKYGAENLTNIGHSQSGIINRKVGTNAKQIINVNPAYTNEKKGKNEINIKSQYDPISMLMNKNDVDYNIKTNSINPLKNHSSKILNNLDENEIIGKGIKNNPWVEFVKSYSKQYNLTYKEAMIKAKKIYNSVYIKTKF